MSLGGELDGVDAYDGGDLYKVKAFFCSAVWASALPPPECGPVRNIAIAFVQRFLVHLSRRVVGIRPTSGAVWWADCFFVRSYFILFFVL